MDRVDGELESEYIARVKGKLQTLTTEIENAVQSSNDRRSLEALKERCLRLVQHRLHDLRALPLYEAKRLNENIQRVLAMITQKINAMGRTPFRFEGEPQPAAVVEAPSLSRPSASVQNVPDLSGVDNIQYAITRHNALLTNLHHSIITSKESGQVHFDQGSDNIFWLHCDGPVFIENLANLIIIVTCHQLRLRRVCHTKVYANVTNNKFVIEECADLSVGTIGAGYDTLYVDDFSDPRSSDGPRRDTAQNVKYVAPLNQQEFGWVKQDCGPIQSVQAQRMRAALNF